MINNNLQKNINQQIKKEISAAYTYLGMSAYFHQESLSGFAHWCMMQYQEELQHADRLFHYLLDRGGKIELGSIESSKCDYTSPLDVFKTALIKEQENTKSINELYEFASSLNDHATVIHLQWFIDEQVEEEKTIEEIVSLLERTNSAPNGILYLSDKLSNRSLSSH